MDFTTYVSIIYFLLCLLGFSCYIYLKFVKNDEIIGKPKTKKILKPEFPESSECTESSKIINKFCQEYSKPVVTPYIIGVCGGSGSGKTFISNLICSTIRKLYPNSSDNDIIIISQDSYYVGGNADTNYDIPSSIDFNLLVDNLKKLISGNAIKNPIYDFTVHKRNKETKTVFPGKIIIVEGILIFTHEKLRNLLDMKIFVNADAPTQIFRRVSRDIKERARTISEVSDRYQRDVWPAYKEFVLPSSKYADLSINNFSDCFVGPQIMLNHIITIYRSLENL